MNLYHARLAAHAWDYALGLCIRTLPKGPEREALLAAEERPLPGMPSGSNARLGRCFCQDERVQAPRKMTLRGNTQGIRSSQPISLIRS